MNGDILNYVADNLELRTQVGTLKARIAYLEEAVRVRDDRICSDHWVELSGEERYVDCGYCGRHPGECLGDCPTVTHPWEGRNGNP